MIKMIKTHCIDDQDKFQSVTDTECQTRKKKLQSTDVSPISLYAFMKTLRAISQTHTKYMLT